MTINANDTSSTTPGTTGTTAPAGPTPALNADEQLVANLNNAIDALVAQIPELQAAHSTTSKFVRTHLNVPLEFIAGAVAAVNNSPALQATNMFNADEGRAALQFIGAFQPLQEKVGLLAQNLQFTINERKANISVKASMLYGTAKQAARLPGNVNVEGHVKLLKEHLARAKRAKKAAGQTPAPAPGSGTVTTPVTPTGPVPVAQPHTTSQEEGGAGKQQSVTQ
jgi:hypothetical protein